MKTFVTYCLLVLLLLSKQNASGQREMLKDSLTVGAKKLYTYVLPKSVKQIFNYEEGVYITYSLKDSSYITIRTGGMVKTPDLDLDSTLERCYKKENEREIFFGRRRNETYYKEIDLNGISIIYDNVKSHNKEIFDFILNNISVTPK